MLYTAKHEAIFLATIVNKPNLMKILLEIILEEEVKEYILLSNKLIKDKLKEKGKEVDILVLVNNKIINIELNTNFSEVIKEKNMSYLERIMLSLRKKGGKYQKLKIEQVIQVNINFNRRVNSGKEYVSIYNETTKTKYLKKPIIINYNIDFYKEMYYTVNSKLTEEQIFWAMLDLSLEELEKLSKEVKFVEEYKVSLIEINDDEFDFTMTEEEKQYYIERAQEIGKEEGRIVGIEEGRKEGRKQGKKEGKFIGAMQSKIEIAKRMLKENFDIESVIKITGLNRRKVEALKIKIN